MIDKCKQLYWKLQRGETLTTEEIDEAIPLYKELIRDLRETGIMTQAADEAAEILKTLEGLRRERRNQC